MPPDPPTIPAVYVQILGGLGNQMFQYAAARSLTERLQCPLKLDISEFATYKRSYRLGVFRIEDSIASVDELNNCFPNKSPLQRFVEKKILGRRNEPRKKGVYQEPHWHFTSELFAQHPPVLLQGYWQSPKYFDSIRGLLLDAFTIRTPVSGDSRVALQRIGETTAVSVHVRRGDYVKDSHVSRVHGSCSLDYYRRAMDMMRRLYREATFFVFTDDPAYIRSSFGFCSDYRLVEGNGDAPEADLYLMSRCRHHIIANSSFSWWGAWLNPSPGKTVIAPRRWFSDETLRHTFTYDLYPDDWITMT